MFTTYFSFNQVLGLLFIAVLHFISVYYFTFKQNIKYALFFLFIGGLAARLLVITFDSYLHMWDEQYHALVAKNMADMNSMIPVLFRDTPLKYCSTIWTESHIWLHKQPFFLWQIALSIKLLGATPFAVRLPSAIMSSILILVIYRLGKLTVSARVGFISGFLFAVCNYLLDFNTGQYNTDHNDIAFIFYVSLSIWAYTECAFGNKPRYIWLIGLFAGLAILTKWLTGFLVFSGWSIALLFIKDNAIKRNEFKNILKALTVCIVTFLPWQIYILLKFPEESRAEYAYSSRHFFEVLEHHGGDYWYYFHQAVEQYGLVAAYALPVALLLLLFDIKNIKIRISYLIFVVIVYLFFTISKTKMPAFCLIISPILFLALGNLLDRIINYFCRFKINKNLLHSLEFILLIGIAVVSFDIETLQAHHTDWIKNDVRAWVNKYLNRTTEFGRAIKGKYDLQKTVVINCTPQNNIPMMFFSGYTAYDKNPTFEEYEYLKKNGYTILFLRDGFLSPEFLINDPDLAIIKNLSESKRVYLKTMNGKYVCADGTLNNPVIANRDNAQDWETFTILMFDKNQCSLLAYNNQFLSAELANQNEITATRKINSTWEIFTMTELEDNRVVFKAANDKYLSVDEKSYQLFAKGESISEAEKFVLVNKK